MRCQSTLLLFTLAATTPVLSQSSNAAATPIKLEDQWTSALVHRDAKTFDRLLAANFVYTEDAAVMSRGDVMKSVTGPDHVEWARNEGMKLHDFGDVHVITGVLHLKGKGEKGSFDRRYQFTDTWQRRNGRWQIIAAQDYLIPK
jgi:ketosteroid isomerase-like protein